MQDALKLLKDKLDDVHFEKLTRLENVKLYRFVADAIRLCEPETVFVCTDDADDIAHIREKAVTTGEERPLATEGLSLIHI